MTADTQQLSPEAQRALEALRRPLRDDEDHRMAEATPRTDYVQLAKTHHASTNHRYSD